MGAQQTLPTGSDLTNSPNVKITDHITISIRGSRKTGKTALVTRMQAKKLYPDYSQTPIMTATEVIWKPYSKENDMISITIWDVVDKAVRHLDVDPNQSLPDASTVDTFSRADGVIIMYDPKNVSSIKYAEKVLKEAPPDIPIVVCSNFSDKNITNIGMPDEIRNFETRILHVHTSMTSNQGLGTVAKWLDLPLLNHKRKQYEEMMKAARNDYINLAAELNLKVSEENGMNKDKNKKVYSVPKDSIIPSGSRDHFVLKGRPNLFSKDQNNEEEGTKLEENDGEEDLGGENESEAEEPEESRSENENKDEENVIDNDSQNIEMISAE